jgi:hypothetical protein
MNNLNNLEKVKLYNASYANHTVNKIYILYNFTFSKLFVKNILNIFNRND